MKSLCCYQCQSWFTCYIAQTTVSQRLFSDYISYILWKYMYVVKREIRKNNLANQRTLNSHTACFFFHATQLDLYLINKWGVTQSPLTVTNIYSSVSCLQCIDYWFLETADTVSFFRVAVISRSHMVDRKTNEQRNIENEDETENRAGFTGGVDM